MTKDKVIMELAFEYVLAMSNSKKYNLQAIANKNFLSRNGKENVIQMMQKPVKDVCKCFEMHKVKDFVYKNDYFTPRSLYLISPLYYTYYTYMVFKLANLYLKIDSKLDFSKSKMSVFYSGLLDLDSSPEDVNRNAKFNKSYQAFQRKRELYFGFPALKIDIQDFFQNIKINELISKLRKLLGKDQIIEDLNYFFKHCNFDSLPQLHYSIASSILSQFYLIEFDIKIQKMLERENIYLIRFVDDMFIVHLDDTEDVKRNNNLLNEISYYLWENSLVLNTSKTKILSPEEYRNDYELIETEYDEIIFSSEKQIDEKAEEVLRNGDLIFLIKKLCDLEEIAGIDLSEYRNLMNEHLSIEGEDTTKVLNHIIFSKKWKEIDFFTLMKMVENWRYILFNPAQFTVLYILVYRFLEQNKIITDNGMKIKEILNYLFTNEVFTFRDTLVAVSYLFQSNFKNKDLVRKVEDVNSAYVEYIEKYLD